MPSPRRQLAGAKAKASGKAWERFLEERLFALLARSELCAWWRTPEALKRLQPLGGGRWACCPGGKGPPDYVLMYGGWGVALEAKSTAQSRWPFQDLKQHQAEHLDAWQAAEGIAGLLIQIRGLRLAVPWRRIGPLWNAWHRNTGRAKPGSASVSPGILRGMGFPLDLGGAWLTRLIEASQEEEMCQLSM